ncbi:hypothetical protein [Nostoc sp.]|uniref:hypothetical protein n=1 Tax=Nostoc sp. TaxID=1180 RepID=UPI002FF8D922
MVLVLRAISFATRNQLLLLRSRFGFDWGAIAINLSINSATAIDGFAVIITPLNWFRGFKSPGSKNKQVMRLGTANAKLLL